MKVNIIVATDSCSGIAKNCNIPWFKDNEVALSVKEDIKKFRIKTVGQGKNIVVMGRKTWESLPEKYRPLPYRTNLVLTGVHKTLEEIISENGGYDEMWIIGGESLYIQTVTNPEYIDEIHITRFEKCYDCDQFFPLLSDIWKCTDMSISNQVSFLVYKK